jgi:signal transduction histidine kinase/CheY-like chemotaxis protein
MRVVLVTPNESDRTLASGFLVDEGVEVESLADMSLLPPRVALGVACIIVVEEALQSAHLEALHDALAMQPAWSDMPLILVAAQRSSLAHLAEEVFPISGNLTVLQRPLHPVSLVSAVKVALRSRRRQYQVRDLLAGRERALSQRDEFLAMLAHELRNPLAPIRNAVYLLGTLKHPEPLFEKSRAMIDKQARHITRLVDDLLDVSRLELGKVELRRQRFDLNESVAAAVEACQPITSEHRHTVDFRRHHAPVFVDADPVRIEQAVGNLIVNAAKFTPASGTIRVEVAVEGSGAVVAVTDNGVGIRPEMLETIFDLFAQSDVTLSRTEGGLGIGLTLVKRLVEMHGGYVTASSPGVGKGSRFEARLPLARNVALPLHQKPSAPASPPRRVLVAEDGEDTRESLGILLRTWNHQVIFASDGPEALRMARESHPDVALIDIGLPGCDGYAVAREIRGEGSGWSRAVRLVALTGYGQSSDKTRALEAGFDVHLLKPVDPVELQGVIAMAA